MKKVLVMDDDISILEILEEALSYENFQVKSSLVSLTAVKIISDYAPDIILLDYLMGEVNGGEVCHQIKSDPKTKHIPVIIMSAYPRVFESLGTYGCDFFLPKPFDLSDLIIAIDKVFKHETLRIRV